jgi:hypothetical protein
MEEYEQSNEGEEPKVGGPEATPVTLAVREGKGKKTEA